MIAAAPAPSDAPADEAAWDADVVRLGGGLLQTWRWGAFKARHGWSVARVRVGAGDDVAVAQVLFKHKGPASVGYVPRGPLLAADDPELEGALLREIDRECRRRRAISLIVEPERGRDPLRRVPGFRPIATRVQPARTVRVPLLDDAALLAQMHQKTRYNIRHSLRKGVTVAREDPRGGGFAAFFALMRDTSERNAFGIHAEAYYRDALGSFGDRDALMVARTPDGEPAAAALAVVTGDEAVYLYGASSTRHRTMQPGFAVQFEAMRWARDRGCRVYDLWGIPAADPETTSTAAGDGVAATRGDDWRGLYEFKVRFGGEVVAYPAPLERGYVPLLPALARRFYARQG